MSSYLWWHSEFIYYQKFSFKILFRIPGLGLTFFWSFYICHQLIPIISFCQPGPVPQCLSVHRDSCLPPCLPSRASSLHGQSVLLTESYPYMVKYLLPLLCSWAAEFCWRKFRPCSDPPNSHFMKSTGIQYWLRRIWNEYSPLSNAVFQKLKIVNTWSLYIDVLESVLGPLFSSRSTLSRGSCSCL